MIRRAGLGALVICLLTTITTDANEGPRADRRMNNVAVAADGKHLSFSAKTNQGWKLYIMDIRSGKAKRASELVNTQYSDWHPKGRYLAFDCVCSPGVSIIFILDTEAGELRNLRNPEGYPLSIGPRWSPDGKSIAFAAFPRTYGSDENWLGDIFIYDLETNTSRLVSDHAAAEEYPVWLDSRTLIVDGTLSGEYRLSKLDIETGRHSPLNHDLSSKDVWADVSPDRRYVVFNRSTSEEGVFDWQPAILDLQTGNVRRYETGLTKASFPRFSADGNAIYFHGGELDNYRLYRLSLTNEDPTPELVNVSYVN